MAFLKPQNIDATTGPLLKKIIIYTIPLILSTLIQQLFNAIDIVVLGKMADSTAVASVSATSAIVALIVNTFVGVSTGTRVVLARYVGAKDEKNARSVADTSLVFAIAVGAVIAVVGYLCSPWFLDIMNTPVECYDGALLYVRIYMMGAPFVLLYNFGSSVITADGDTQRPLYYIMVAGATNVILNIILCFLLEEKVAAVAIATLASQLIGSILVCYRLAKVESICRVNIKRLQLRIWALGKVLAEGLPMALVNALFPLSNLQIQSAINSYGVAATAGNGAAATIENVVVAFSGPFSTSGVVFFGQNIGAKNPQRVKKAFWIYMLLAVVIGGGVGVATYLTGRFWLSLMVGADVAAIEFGLVRMFYTTFFYFVVAINGIFASAILAHGYSMASAINSIFSVFVFRFIWMQALYPYCQTFAFVMACFVVSWTITMLINIVMYCTIWHKYRKKMALPPCEE